MVYKTSIILGVLLSTITIFLSATPASQCTLAHYHHQPSPPSWTEKYKISILAGGIIGTSTGTLCAFADAATSMMLFPITWYVSKRVRHTVVKSITQTMDEDRVAHCKYIITDTAWLSSWASWCVIMRMIW